MRDFQECLNIVSRKVSNDLHSLEKLLDISEVIISERVRGNLSRILDSVANANPEEYYFVEIYNEELKARCILVFEGGNLLRVAFGGTDSNVLVNPEDFCRRISDSEIALFKVVLPLLQWKQDMVFGFEPMDSQHEKILHKWNELIRELLRGEGKEAVVLKELVNEVFKHLAYEEDLMRRYKYPKAKQHFKDHEAFRSLLNQLISRADKIGVIGMLRENIGFVYAYLAHLNSADRELASFLKKNIL
ncbi:bacteriohemerythrin [Thermosphaera aggregans]|uniref:bacteriohemerythrin n=1 Tax=Thermosphaera aggregans TaxID=54254 RepID=UPI00069C8412|nr:hemerythrin family protein [Thermosphaera aggregans]